MSCAEWERSGVIFPGVWSGFFETQSVCVLFCSKIPLHPTSLCSERKNKTDSLFFQIRLRLLATNRKRTSSHTDRTGDSVWFLNFINWAGLSYFFQLPALSVVLYIRDNFPLNTTMSRMSNCVAVCVTVEVLLCAVNTYSMSLFLSLLSERSVINQYFPLPLDNTVEITSFMFSHRGKRFYWPRSTPHDKRKQCLLIMLTCPHLPLLILLLILY